MATDFMAKINALRASKGDLLQQVDALTEAGDVAGLEKLSAKMEDTNKQIQALENLAAASRDRAAPGATGDDDPEGEGSGAVPKANKTKVTPFSSLGEQLQAIVQAKKTGLVDKRLLQVNNALGANESSGADGGFAVQEDFAGAIFDSVYESSDIIPRLDTYTVGANSNSARWLQVAETDVSKAVFGGVQMFWAAEAAAVNASKPNFREVKCDLEKMMGFAYATDELLQDAPFMTGFFGTAFTLAADMLLTEGVISGDGIGKPLGILNSKALVTADKVANQAAGTLVTENILAMWQRLLVRNRKDAVWMMHPDLETELPKLKLEDKLVWMPEGGLSGSPYQTIFGRPIMFTDSCSAQGSRGDIILSDLKQYMLLKKGTAKQDWSMHVEFLTDQMCFRIVFRCNGIPKMSAPVKIRNSTKTRSPYVTLAARG